MSFGDITTTITSDNSLLQSKAQRSDTKSDTFPTKQKCSRTTLV